MIEVTAIYVHGADGFERDDEVKVIMGKRGGERLGGGTFTPTNERDLQYCFADETAAAETVAELRTRGFQAIFRPLSSSMQ